MKAQGANRLVEKGAVRDALETPIVDRWNARKVRQGQHFQVEKGADSVIGLQLTAEESRSTARVNHSFCAWVCVCVCIC